MSGKFSGKIGKFSQGSENFHNLEKYNLNVNVYLTIIHLKKLFKLKNIVLLLIFKNDPILLKYLLIVVIITHTTGKFNIPRRK